MTDRNLSEAAVVGVLAFYQTEGWPGNQLVLQRDIAKRIEEKIRALPAAPDAEPVAWIREVRGFSSPDTPDEYDTEWTEVKPKNMAGWTPLYTAPPSSERMREALEELAEWVDFHVSRDVEGKYEAVDKARAALKG